MSKLLVALALLTANLEAQADGFTLGVGNVFGQLATQSGAQGGILGVDEVLRQLSTQINLKMPVSVDQNTRLDRVSTAPGRRFLYHYTIVADADASDTALDFSKEVKPQLKTQLCGNTENIKFLKNGVSIAYLYKDSGGRAMGGAEFTPSDCGYRT